MIFEGVMNFIHLLDLIEKQRLDEILGKFTDLTGISSFIVDPEGEPISDEHNWTPLCRDYCRSTHEGKRRCYESDRYGGQMSAKLRKRFIYPCLNAGLIDCTSPIIVGNYHIATFMCGQVLHKPKDKAAAERHAKEIGIADISGYIQAIKRIPVISHERLNTIVVFMEVVTKTISELAWNKYMASQQSSRYLDRLVNRVTDGIISIDTRGRISMVNDAFTKIVGRKKHEIIGRHFSTYMKRDDSVETYRNILGQVSQKGHGRASLNITDSDCRKIPVQVAFTESGTDAEHSKYVAVIRDVSEEMKIANLKEDLIGMMTHDLGNPIFSIQKAMQLLASGIIGPLNTDQEELIRLAMNTTQQLSGMVMDYLDIYRYENGKLRLRKELLDIRPIVEESIKQARLIADEKEVSIYYNAPQEALHVMADRMRLVRIYMNLLGNAIKCSPRGNEIEVDTRHITNEDGMLCDAYFSSGEGQIHKPEPGCPYLLSEITDRGPGIKKKFQRDIFNKFFTLKPNAADTPTGVGLGLAFCKLAVEAHRGFIWVKSPIDMNRLGRGSKFCFVLPAGAKVTFDSVGMEF